MSLSALNAKILEFFGIPQEIIERTASLKVELSPSQFPMISLDIYVLDDDGSLKTAGGNLVTESFSVELFDSASATLEHVVQAVVSSEDGGVRQERVRANKSRLKR